MQMCDVECRMRNAFIRVGAICIISTKHTIFTDHSIVLYSVFGREPSAAVSFAIIYLHLLFAPSQM